MTQQTELKGLYGIFFKKLKKLDKKVNMKIIPFPTVFQKICPSFCISKKDCWDVIFLLRDCGIIEIVPYHGIKIV